MSKFLLRISSLVTVLSYCLAFLPCLSFATESGVISSQSKYIPSVKGRYRYYYDENSVCESVVMLNVGTAMSNGDYSDLALDTIRATGAFSGVDKKKPPPPPPKKKKEEEEEKTTTTKTRRVVKRKKGGKGTAKTRSASPPASSAR